MPPPFEVLTVDEFARKVTAFGWTRRVTDVHWHHTYKPNKSDFKASDAETLQNNMYRYHTENNGWSDIGQHVSIMPDGTVVTGRDWNRAPASAKGHNGNAASGPFMFEMVADFTTERLVNPQREAAIQVAAIIQNHFGLAAAAMKFHKEMSSTECPGLDLKVKDKLIREVADARNMKGYRRSDGYESWDGGRRREDLEHSGTVKDANKSKILIAAGAAGTAASGLAGLFKVVDPLFAGIALVIVLLAAVAGGWYYLTRIKRRRREDHARGVR